MTVSRWSSTVRVVVVLAVTAVTVVGISEVTMRPNSTDRLTLLGVIIGSCVLAGGAGVGVPRVSRRITSLRRVMMLNAVAALAIVGVTVVAAAATMFLSNHDLNLVMIALGLGVGLGSILAVVVADPLRDDLDAIRHTVTRVAAGDLAVRTNVQRTDEVGEVARTLDAAIGQLAAADEQRVATDEARRWFLATVSHDLRTPLTSMRVAVEAIQDGMTEDPEADLKAMAREIVHMSGLVEDLSLVGRIESGGLELTTGIVDVAELADEAVEAMMPAARHQAVMLLLDADPGAVVDGAPRELARVVRNLLDNAIRHCPTGGSVRVAVRQQGARVEVEVSDDGPGFPVALLPTAFDAFTRADDARERRTGGAGLGLAIARGLVEAHGGGIGARPGPGGAVALWLPSAGGHAGPCRSSLPPALRSSVPWEVGSMIGTGTWES